MDHIRPLSVYFRSLHIIYRIKTVDFRRIRTRIDGVEGEQADQYLFNLGPLTTMTKWLNFAKSGHTEHN